MMMMKTIVTTVKVRVMVKVIVTKINFKMILMISDNGDNESDAGDDMMMMMMMMMMMTVKMTMMMLLMMIMMTTMMLMMIMTMMMTVMMMMMMLMMMTMMMMMTMIRRRRRDRMKNTNINIAVCIYNSCSIHVRLFSYTCFAPVFIRRSCLISRMINFRSFAVHLKMTKGKERKMI